MEHNERALKPHRYQRIVKPVSLPPATLVVHVILILILYVMVKSIEMLEHGLTVC